MSSSRPVRPAESGQSPADLLDRASRGDGQAASQLLPIVYDELRRLAGGYLRREQHRLTLQPTALVHEAYLRLVKPGDRPWTGRTHFLAIAALSMRQVLVDRARRRAAAKRGGAAQQRITLDDALLAAPGAGDGVDLVALDRALVELEARDPVQASIVELRYFGGLTIEETAAAVHLSPATVKRHWAIARAFLRQAIDAATT